MTKKLNIKIAYETLNKYLNISKEDFNKLSNDNIEILLNFVSNELNDKNKFWR